MLWLYAAAIGIVVGLGLGYLAERVPIAPVVQSVAAALMAMLVGTVLMGLIWLIRPGGLGGVFIGIGVDNILIVAGLCLLVAVVHIVLGRASVPPALANHRAMVLGCAGGLCGALSVAWAMVSLETSG